MLVNNAGMAALGPMASADLDRVEAMIQVNVVAVTRLAGAAVPSFVARGRGTVINMASVVALAPELFSGGYSASKAFVLNLTLSLHQELGNSGVRVQAVLPGATRTEIWKRAGVDISTLDTDAVMDVEEMVDAALAGLDQGELVTIPSLEDPANWEKFSEFPSRPRAAFVKEARRRALPSGQPLIDTEARRDSARHKRLTQEDHMQTQEVVLCHPVRTAIGTYNGSLKTVPATELGATAIRETLSRAGLDGARIDTVVMGNVIQAGNRMNPARQAAIGGGLPVSVPAMTVNRVCGSGAQAIVTAAQEIWLGQGDAAIAGGMENMDRAPYLLDGGRWGYRMGHAEIYDSMLLDGLNDAFSGEHSGWHTEDLVTRMQITREAQDRWAERSQQRFGAAQAEGKFEAEIVPVQIKGRKGVELFRQDESPRPETTLAILAKLRPAFREDGSITAGNAPGLNSGASAMIVASRTFADFERYRAVRAPGVLRRRGGRAWHVRVGSRSRYPAGARAGELASG